MKKMKNDKLEQYVKRRLSNKGKEKLRQTKNRKNQSKDEQK